MRSPREISFRLRQEAANAWLLWNPPAWQHALTGPLAGLPDPAGVAEGLRGSLYAQWVGEIAQELMEHRFRLLGMAPVELGRAISWRRDFLHGQETTLPYFRRIPYLDFERVGDHKVIWELNRHQHLVVLAQAHLFTGRSEFLEEIRRQLESWMTANPFQRGINWTSALEVGFRALSWMWVLHLSGKHFQADFRKRWLNSLYQHGVHLEHNLSVYFSPNTHLLGEAVALHALGQLLPEMPRATRWRDLGGEIVVEQMNQQVRTDGSHFEQSSYYHLYALDFFLFHFLIARSIPVWYREKLARMAEFLNALVSDTGILPSIGDEDGGRLFHPLGDRRRFAQATLSTCALALNRSEWLRDSESIAEQAAWWLKSESAPVPVRKTQTQSQWFADAGLAVMRSECAQVIVDAGPFGPGNAGHSHADTLSITAFRNGAELLIDAGTLTYVADPEARDCYRGTAAHNTILIRGQEQAIPQGPFRWRQPPSVELLHWNSNSRRDILDARCSYGGFSHRRSIWFQKPDALVVVDRVTGPAGTHTVEQRWLCPGNLDPSFLSSLPEAAPEAAQRSRAFGSSESAVRWVARRESSLPSIFVALISFERPRKLQKVRNSEEGVVVEYEEGGARFPESGPPEAIL